MPTKWNAFIVSMVDSVVSLRQAHFDKLSEQSEDIEDIEDTELVEVTEMTRTKQQI